MKITIETLLSIIGILLAITTFVAPDIAIFETNITFPVKIVVGLSPLVLLAIYWAWRYWRKSLLSFSMMQAIETFRLHRALRCQTSMTVTIANEEGDAIYKRTFKYYLVKNYELSESPPESLYSVSELSDLKITPKVTESIPQGIKLKPQRIEQPKITIAGIEHFCYRWNYKINPPLQKKNDLVEYQYQITLPGEEKKAFSEEGSQAFFLIRKGYTKSSCFLIAPPNYEIKIIEAFVLDNRGKKNTTDFSEPILHPNRQILEWKPKLQIGSRYVVNYRLVRQR